MNFCPHCGGPLKVAGAKFCGRCGQALPAGAGYAAAPPPVSAPQPTQVVAPPPPPAPAPQTGAAKHKGVDWATFNQQAPIAPAFERQKVSVGRVAVLVLLAVAAGVGLNYLGRQYFRDKLEETTGPPPAGEGEAAQAVTFCKDVVSQQLSGRNMAEMDKRGYRGWEFSAVATPRSQWVEAENHFYVKGVLDFIVAQNGHRVPGEYVCTLNRLGNPLGANTNFILKQVWVQKPY